MKKVDAERLNRALLESAYPSIRTHVWDTRSRKAADVSDVFGNANLALLISAVIAIWVLASKRGLSRVQIAHVVEQSLMSGGVIILITASGGAFGKMLDAAQIGPAIQSLFSGTGGASTSSIAFLLLGFLIAAVLKIAQGSSTVAMIVGSGMVAAIVTGQELAFHPVYLATAIGAGSLFGSWMNDSGFWIFAKMSGLTEVEALKSWTPMLIVLSLVGLGSTIVLALVLPLNG
jgi:H+/gluconate symporter-like permease